MPHGWEWVATGWLNKTGASNQAKWDLSISNQNGDLNGFDQWAWG